MGIYLLIFYATTSWPAGVRIAFVIFILVMMYGLIATREHYTIDLLLAIPCSFLAYSLARLAIDQLRNTRFACAAAL